jgi:hypothetical protein
VTVPHRLSHLRSTVALALAIAAVAAPSASASAIDKVSPDARDAGRPVLIDRVSPDARDAGRPVVIDKVSPDAHDNGRREPAPVVVTAPPVAAADGFHWLDAGLGAAAIVALLALAGGAAATRRHPLRVS